MKPAAFVCYLLNRVWPKPKQKTKEDGSISAVTVKELVEKRSRLRNPDRDATKYESGSFVRRYQHRLTAYRHIGDHEKVFRDKVVLDLGTGRGEGVFHLVLDKQVKFSIGVDIDAERCAFARQMLADYQIENARIVCADAANMREVESDSVDVVVSAATFEHIPNVEGVLKEAHRVLKPGGILYAQFSPIWTNYYGAHMAKWLPFPWTHLIFSPETVRNVLARVRGVPTETISVYEGLNRLNLRQYKQAIAASSFRVLGFLNISYHPLKKYIVKMPRIAEYISGGNVIFLQKDSA